MSWGLPIQPSAIAGLGYVGQRVLVTTPRAGPRSEVMRWAGPGDC